MDIVKNFLTSDNISYPIRILGSTGNPLFVLSDVGKVMGMANIRMTVKDFDSPEEKQLYEVQTTGGNQQIWVLTEAGLYHMLYISRMEMGKIFRQWVANIVRELRLNGIVILEKSLSGFKKGVEDKLLESDMRLQQYKNKACFYLIKVADLEDNKQVLKIGQTTGNLLSRFATHSRNYADFSTLEGKKLLLNAWECVNPLEVEIRIKERIFPRHRYEFTAGDGRSFDELVLVDPNGFKFSDLTSVIQSSVQEIEGFRNEVQMWKTKFEYADELLQRKEIQLSQLMSAKMSSVSGAAETRDAQVQTMEEEKVELRVVEIMPKRRNVRTPSIQKIHPDGTSVAAIYDCMSSALQQNEGTTRSSILNAMRRSIATNGFYWKYAEEGQKDLRTVLNFTPEVTTKPKIECIAKVSADKSRIIQVFPSQRAVAAHLEKSESRVWQLTKRQQIYDNHYYVKWNELDNALKSSYLSSNNDIVCYKDVAYTIRQHVLSGQIREYKGAPCDVARAHCVDEVAVDSGKEHLGFIWRKEIRPTPIYSHELH